MPLSPLLATTLALTLGTGSPCDPPPRSWLQILGLTSGTLRGPEETIEGDLYVTRADGSIGRQRLTEAGGYRSPVFHPDKESVLALRGASLVQIPLNEGIQEGRLLMDLPGAQRLAGFTVGNSKVLVALVKEGNTTKPVLICLDSMKRVDIPDDQATHNDVNSLLGSLRSSMRRYDSTTVESKESDKGGRSVFVRKDGGEPIDVGRCEKDVCGQAALSKDGSKVVFVRRPAGEPTG